MSLDAPVFALKKKILKALNGIDDREFLDALYVFVKSCINEVTNDSVMKNTASVMQRKGKSSL